MAFPANFGRHSKNHASIFFAGFYFFEINFNDKHRRSL